VAITVLKNNVPWGPFTRAQIQDGLKRGDFTLQYLAHGPGLKEWLPLGEVLDHLDRSGLPPVPPVSSLVSAPSWQDRPAIPGTDKGPDPPAVLRNPTVPVPDPVAVKRGSGPPPLAPPSKAVPQKVQVPAGPSKPASFFARFIAFVIDCLVLFLPVLFLFGLGAMTIAIQGALEHTDRETMHQEWELLWRNFRELLLLVILGGAWLYAACLECSGWQATIGKRWVGMKVTDVEGQRMSFFRATGRHVAKVLSGLPCFFGFIMALFSSRGLALHDRLAGTRVVKK
jgi:uncharacterized RDD family membrane protein YckC